MAVVRPLALGPELNFQLMLDTYGDTARTRIHLLSSDISIVTTVPVELIARMLSEMPQFLLHIPKRLAHGPIVPVYLRAGAVAFIEAVDA